jgi:hypothetical protein
VDSASSTHSYHLCIIMSFSVKAGGSPHQQHSSHVSPSLSHRGGGSANTSHSNPPPFSLGEAHNGNSAPPSGAAEIAIPLPASKRMGTDPSKYKTTICRNWEQTGACSFRGCTFAHGADELRQAARTGTSPPLGPLQGQQSPSSTPPMYPQQPAMNTSRIEQIMEMLMTEVQRERELVSAHMEARKSSDAQLRREQHTVADLQSAVEASQSQVAELARLVMERNHEILELIGIAGPNLTAERRKKAELIASVRVGAFASSAPGSSSNKEASSRGNNPSAPVWVPSQTSPSLAAMRPDETPEDDDAKLKSLLESLRQH